MASTGFMDQDEIHPTTSKCNKNNLQRKLLLLHHSGSIDFASVPRKLRSGIKKRGSESIMLKEKHHLDDEGATLKNCAKTLNRKHNMKKGRITKDEKEVAETLYALSNMFSDGKEINKLDLNGEPSETEDLPIQESRCPIIAIEDTVVPERQEESINISTKVTLEAVCHSSNLTTSHEPAVALEQVAAPGYPNYRNKGFYQSPSLSAFGDLSSKSQAPYQKSSIKKLPAWLKNAKLTPQAGAINNIVNECAKVVVESRSSWKRCSAHVYISRLINILQISETKEERFPQKPTESTCEENNAVYINNAAEKKSSGEIQNAIHLHNRLLQNQLHWQQGSEISSLHDGGRDLDANRAGLSHEAIKKFHISFLQSQNHSSMPFSLPQSFPGSTSAVAGQQVQHSPYPSNKVDYRLMRPSFGKQLESQNQNRNHQVQTEYNFKGLEWQNGGRYSSSMLNYDKAHFQHLHSGPNSNYRQFSPSQSQFMAINSSLPLSTSNRGNMNFQMQ